MVKAIKAKELDFPPLYQNNHKRFIKKLIKAYPSYTFKIGPRFSFHPPNTIIIGPPEPNFALLALHELGHALSGLYSYSTHVERIKIESAAWSEAKALCKKHHIKYDSDFVEAQLDTYRDWLHAKSKCKTCGLTCYQTKDGKYHCPLCGDR